MTKLYSLIFWVFVVGTVSTYPHVAIADNFQNIGVVDSFAISSTSDDLEFTAAGWVGAGKPEADVMSLIVELGSVVIYEGRFTISAARRTSRTCSLCTEIGGSFTMGGNRR